MCNQTGTITLYRSIKAFFRARHSASPSQKASEPIRIPSSLEWQKGIVVLQIRHFGGPVFLAVNVHWIEVLNF